MTPTAASQRHQTAKHRWTLRDDAAFRWLARRYELVSRDRARIGTQIQAIVEGRDPAWRNTALDGEPIDRILVEIRTGRRDTPAPVAQHYGDLWETEHDIRRQLAAQLNSHPAGPWLSHVSGVGTTLAAQLLARLDRSRAKRPSSFWAYCGLATAAATRVQCEECGLTTELPVGGASPPDHEDQRVDGLRCRAPLTPVDDDTDDQSPPVRVAAGRVSGNGAPRFDQVARSTCHLIGQSMIRTHGTYEPVYRAACERFSREREGWSSGRIHLSAMRVMEKQFLLDLWHAWAVPAGPADTVSASA